MPDYYIMVSYSEGKGWVVLYSEDEVSVFDVKADAVLFAKEYATGNAVRMFVEEVI